MADEEPDSEHVDAGALTGIISGIRGVAENLVRAAGTVNPLSELPALPEVATHPGAISAAQFTAMSSTLTAQRDSIAALQSQLTAFDEQLQVLERLLGPMAEWSAAWARLEGDIVPGQSAPPADES
jgi:hypothetical protein